MAHHAGSRRFHTAVMALVVIVGLVGDRLLHTGQAIAHAAGRTLAVQRGAGPVTSQSVFARFDWRMPDRFGLDRNRNGLIDLPNTSEYVHNLAPGSCRGRCHNVIPRFDVTFDASASFALGSPINRYSWAIARPGVTAVLAQGTGRQWTVQLAEGLYDVTLTVEAAGYRRALTQRVPVEDILIVAIGDSYSSGEGNPERGQAQTADDMPRWAEDGTSNPNSPVNQDHIRSHRSTLSWPAQVALAIERADPRTSVTFISVAASGATVLEGLLGPYAGVDNEPLSASLPKMRSQLRQVMDLVGCKGARFNSQGMRVESGCDRRIDALTISIGGNDIGFGNIIKSLMLRGLPDVDINYHDIATRVYTGEWESLEDQYGLVGWFSDIPMPNTDGLRRLPLRLRDLQHDIRRYLDVFHTYILPYPDASEYYKDGDFWLCRPMIDDIIEQPGSRAKRPKVGYEEAQWAYEHVITPLNKAIYTAGSEHAWHVVGGIEEAFRGHGYCAAWPYSPEEYPGNPYPAGQVPWPTEPGLSWFRTASQSSHIQGPGADIMEIDGALISQITAGVPLPTIPGVRVLNRENTRGTMHPNEFGHQAIKERLLDEIVLPVAVPGVGWIDPDDQFSEATVLSLPQPRFTRGGAVGGYVSTTGYLYSPTDVNMYRVSVSADSIQRQFQLRVNPRLGSHLVNPALRVFNSAGTALASYQYTPAQPAASLQHTFGAAGEYYIGVSAGENTTYDPVTGLGDQNGGSQGAYELVISVSTPPQRVSIGGGR